MIELPEKFFNYDLKKLAAEKHEAYATADPFPNISFDNFVNEELLKKVIAEFPSLGKDKDDIHYSNPNEEKHASKGTDKLGPYTKALINEMNSLQFIEFLQTLTGIKEPLIPDPYLHGGGFHQIKPGGFLKLHVDFHKHNQMLLDRRINVLLYLNDDWKEEYGGHFELWKRDMSERVVRILPTYNKLAMFSTTDYSWHGHPDPLNCPPDRSRKSLAMYYYSNGRPDDEISSEKRTRITTTFAARKGQDSGKMSGYNTMVNMVNDFLPPVLVRVIKRFRKV